MDVMDLIKLASGEDSDRRICIAEEGSCILDSGDASVSGCNEATLVEGFARFVGLCRLSS